ncbi:hypothetical protein [Paraburkholderia sp. ZP32-5]|uniref:hypothetical protein n=1 Tax=Paraburkholderia sp. ZP32-5 TaxID=2883245 RepID=UPI001F469B8B|nr:hypothetical protein [Paraburkholderia sp. ZP32-5]
MNKQRHRDDKPVKFGNRFRQSRIGPENQTGKTPLTRNAIRQCNWKERSMKEYFIHLNTTLL